MSGGLASATDDGARRAWALDLGLAVLLFAVKAPTLSDPYYWDDQGGPIRSALDMVDHGFRLLIPGEVNWGHTPLLPLLLALAWKVFGSTPVVSHLVILILGALTLAWTRRLAEEAFGRVAGLAAALLLLSDQLFFAQLGLANDAVPLAAFTVGTVAMFRRQSLLGFGVMSVLLVLAKETGAVVVMALFGSTVLQLALERRAPSRREVSLVLMMALPAAVLVGWSLYLRYALGWSVRRDLIQNAFFFWDVLRESAFRQLLWDNTPNRTNSHHVVWSVLALVGVALHPSERKRTMLPLALGILAHLVLFSYTADLPRYHVPYLPLFAVAAASAFGGGGAAGTLPTLRFPGTWGKWRAAWVGAAALVSVGLSLRNFGGSRSGRGFELESNLEYRDALETRRRAAAKLESEFPSALVATCWPLGDALSDPRLGLVKRRFEVVDVSNAPPERLSEAEVLLWSAQSACRSFNPASVGPWVDPETFELREKRTIVARLRRSR